MYERFPHKCYGLWTKGRGRQQDFLEDTAGEINILTIFIYKELKKLCSDLYINEITELVVAGKEPLYSIYRDDC